jgi:hypothetical protein
MASASHPFSWIRANDQVVLVIGMTLWFSLAVVTLIFLLCTCWRVGRRRLMMTAVVRFIVVAAMLGVAYMYTEGRELIFERKDGVLVRVPMVVINGCIDVLLVVLGSEHCVLESEYAKWTLWLSALAAAQTTVASFVPAAQQWPAFVVGSLFYVPIPLIWMVLHRRSQPRRINIQVYAWIFIWLALRLAYTLVQLTGHTFAGKNGIGTTAELALMLCLHTATGLAFFYEFWWLMLPPPKRPYDGGLARVAPSKRRNSDDTDTDIDEPSPTILSIDPSLVDGTKDTGI